MATIDETGLTRGQFTLRNLLILTTGAAVLCALGPLVGRYLTVILAGMYLCLANHLRFFSWCQRPRIAQFAIYGAFGLWAIGLLLPVFQFNGTVRGYEASLMLFGEIVRWLKSSLGLHTVSSPLAPHAAYNLTNVVNVGLAALVTAANIGVIVCAVGAHRLAVGQWKWLHGLMLVGTPMAWSLLGDGLSWHAGFYFWVAAITLPCIVLPIRVRGFSLVMATSLILMMK